MKFTIKTIGCKVNTYESNKIKNELINLGFDYLDVKDKESYKDLDFYIVNTCSVTSIADKKSRQMLHLAKKYNKNVKVIAIGCLVNSLNVGADNIRPIYCLENEPDSEAHTKKLVDKNIIASVDYLIPNDEKDKLPELILSLSNNVGTSPKTVGANYTSPHRIRAFIKIQDGCDEYCTYCLIPYLRGHIRSRDEDDILSEIKECIKQGMKEVVLTGIHLSSFGIDKVKNSDGGAHLTYESTGAISVARDKLISLLNQIANLKVNIGGEIRELERIRLGSLEPRIIDEKFLSAIAPKIVTDNVNDKVIYRATETYKVHFDTALSKKFCANFCLSLQSGCDKTLKRMNRHYTVNDFEMACNLIRKYIPYASITTDVIVGFPGETENDFEESLSFVKRMRFYNPNIFPYSIRKGTRAAEFTDQLSNSIKHDRSVKMIKECEIISDEVEKEILALNEKIFGHDANKILVEEIIEKDGNKYKVGYTKEYIKRVEQ